MTETKSKTKLALPYIGIPVIISVLLILRAGNTDAFLLLWYGLSVIFGYIAALHDLKTQCIRNELVLAMLAVWVMTMTPKLFLDTEVAIRMLMYSALGFAVSGGLFFLVYLISRKGLGGGDVKFIAAAGLYLGFAGIVPTILYGTILAALVGVTLIALKKINRKDKIPLAPFLYAGMLIVIFTL